MLETTIAGNAIQIGPRFAVSFHRTLRIPDDGKSYPLPPGLGMFPIFRVSEFRDHLPASWSTGTVFIPMHRQEALWLGFHGTPWKPNAIQVAVGGINALTGHPDQPALHANPQDYLVTPQQPWLDGINIGTGRIRQFVAVPLGFGDTVEAALTGEERHGGIQITVFEPNPGVFPDEQPVVEPSGPFRSGAFPSKQEDDQMGLGAGGQMRQKLYPDPHGIEVWNQSESGRAVVYLIGTDRFREITGVEPPPTPIDASAYTEHGFPWFELDDDDQESLDAADRLLAIDSVQEREAARGARASPEATIDVGDDQVHSIEPAQPATHQGTQTPKPEER